MCSAPSRTKTSPRALPGVSPGLDAAISAVPAPWRKPRVVHDSGKILLDKALAVALGRDCLADVAMLRAEGVKQALESCGARSAGQPVDTEDRQEMWCQETEEVFGTCTPGQVS